MIPILFDIAQNAIAEDKAEIDRFIKISQKKLEGLLSVKKKPLKGRKIKYVNYLKTVLPDLVFAKPYELSAYKDNFNKILPYYVVSSDSYKEFRNEVIATLRYKEFRSTILPRYFQKIGIKACVYCNSQITVSAECLKRNGHRELTGKFQADHYIPKYEYPCLSISLYNLYPVCGICNISKSTT